MPFNAETQPQPQTQPHPHDYDPSLPSITSLTPSTLSQALSTLFEPSSSPTLTTLLSPHLPFSSYASLVAFIRQLLLNEPPSTILPILTSHPRLGATSSSLSALSKTEQQSSNLQHDDSEGEKLKQLNDEYERKFSGLRYLVFVNGRPREEILREMRERIQGGDWDGEVVSGINAICDIALDRAGKLGRE